MKFLIYRLYAIFMLKLRQNKSIFRFLFGFNPVDRDFGNYWDWTTLELRKALLARRNPEPDILDMGTGPYGVLAYFACIKLHFSQVTGTDYQDMLVSNARKQVQNTPVRFLTGDLFEAADRRYDIVLFNAPYIDSVKANSLGVLQAPMDKLRWSGGREGIETIERFLDELPRYLKPGGCALLGVNLFHIRAKTVFDALEKAHLKIEKVQKNSFTRSSVFTITSVQVESAEL